MDKRLILPLGVLPVYVIADLYRYTFCRSRSLISQKLLDKKSHAEDYYLRRDSAADRLRGTVHLRYSIRSDRGETLQGFYYPCGARLSKNIVFIVHGYHSEHLETAGMFYELYHRRGFDVFTCDNTASGESGGHLFGYDYFESADCLKWLDFLQKEFGSDINVIVHGFSLGGATVLKMSDRCPACVKFIVSDSGFLSGEELLKSKLGILYPLMERINRAAAGYKLSDTDVRENVKRAKLPFLIVHGKDDPTVPFTMAPRIFELCPEGSDHLYTEGARHIETIHNNRTAYEEKLDAFIAKYIKTEESP